MVSSRYSELGQNPGVPDVEFTWYWNLLIYSSPWLLTAGFILFPLSIDHQDPDMLGNRWAIMIVSVILIGLSYLFCGVCFVRWRRSDTLQDFILIPFFGSSLSGLFNIVVNVTVRGLYPMDALTIAGIVLASVSTLAYGGAALYNSKFEKYLPRFLKNRRRFKDSGIDDAELQRRQLLKLYMKRDSDRAPSVETSKSTFRIDIPEIIGPDYADAGLRPPQHTYERYSPQTTPPIYHTQFEMQEVKQGLPAAIRTRGPSPSKGRHLTPEERQPLAELVP